MKYIIILFLLCVAFGCKKDETPTYQGADGISFFIRYYADPDSINYSFALQPDIKSRDTVFIRMRLAGKPSATARGIKLRAVEGTTARLNTDYILPEIQLPPYQLEVSYPLIVLNSPEMQTKTFRLVLAVDPGSELVAGAPGLAADYSLNLKQMKINITGLLVEPDYWLGSYFFFGDFSVVKFQFMIKTTGLTNFDSQKISFGELFRIQVQLKRALQDYEQLNGPLIDELGNQVIF